MSFEEADVHRRLDADGRPLEDGYEPPLADERLVELYRDLRLARHFDERMISLQRQGRLGTYASLAGQEGSQFGSMYALEDDDWVFYQYREHGAVVDRGGLADYVRYWMGHESGNAALVDHAVAPLNISVGAHVPHATGMAWAAALRGDDAAVVCHLGEGATSEGDFHEGLNFAGVFDVPAVFVCHNNGWAISVPAERQTASDTFARKAEAYGLPGVRVDGMDPLATYEVVSEALERAKDPDGSPATEGAGRATRPTLVEAVEYRFGAHTTADDPSAYRDDATVERWREWDPVSRLEGFLRSRGALDDERAQAVGEAVRQTVADAVERASDVEADHRDLFADAYADPTPRVEAQGEYLDRLVETYGREALLEED
jgi:pyruvate dehydrogenase E1 component alpha subunit